MLKVSVHSGGPADETPYNRLAWAQITYLTRRPIADYRVMLFTAGAGARPPVELRSYPRWSGSLFTLLARGIAVALHGAEHMPPALPPVARCAYATDVSVFIDHQSTDTPHRARLGSLRIRRDGPRGHYHAELSEDILGDTAAKFAFAPARLNVWDLVLQAIAWSSTGGAELPRRPGLVAPPPRTEEDGSSWLVIEHLAEPARSGFLRWLVKNEMEPTVPESGGLGAVPDHWYGKFLWEAV